MPTRERARRGQRGQVVPIAALCSALLLGGAALAVDLSLQTDRHLDLQNATDAAALVAARDLGATNGGKPNQPDRKQAAIDGLRVVYDHMGWGTAGTTWATGAVGTTCDTGSNCHVTTTGAGAAGAGVTVTVDVPPLTAHNSAYNEVQGTPGSPWGYAAVLVREQQAQNFQQAVGLPRSNAGAQSVGYHFPGGQPFGFALYSGTLVGTGNQSEVINGNVYAYRDVQPQSSGQANFCANTDSNGNAGHVILGAPQSGAFPNPDPASGAAYQHNILPAAAQQIVKAETCAGLTGGQVGQTASVGSCGTLTVQGVSMTTVQDGTSLACMANPPLTPPTLQGPSQQGNVVTYDGTKSASGQPTLNVTSPLAQGLYVITHNPNCAAPGCVDVLIGSGAPNNCTGTYTPTYTTCLLGVTFWLDKGATIGISSKANVIISPYMPPSDNSNNPNDGRFSVYAPTGSAAGIYVTNNGTTAVLSGTLYMPSGTMSVTQNATIGIDGQAIVNAWQVQSGNKQNPEIIYDPSAVAKQREMLQVIE